mgnify:CR=1 FL=1
MKKNISSKDTLQNIIETKCFVVNVVSKDLLNQMNQTSGNYPKNTDFEVDYVFSNPASYESLRNTSVKLRYTFLEMPQDNGFEIRFEDPRIGYFTDRVTDLSSTEITPYRDLVQKWNLQKQDPDAAKSKPIKPIKFWLENTTPNELRPLIIKAVLSWNLAFEKAGFIDAIEVDVQPDDADWDAGDIRYNVLRWTSSPNPPFGGYGPSFSNPRTGEILSADIMLEWIFLTNRMRYEDIFLSSEVSSERCNFSSMRNEQRIFGNLVASSMDFSIEDTDKLFDEELNSYYESVKAEFEDFLKIEIAKESKEMAPLIEKGVLGGKMLRPVLCRLVSDALDGDAHLAFECGMALELVHGGALIHDDWIDGDSFRRAAPALWEELGPRSAILIADLMVATGSLHGAVSMATGKSLAKCIRNLSEGAIADFTDKQNYSESVYLHRIKHQTADQNKAYIFA